MENKYSTSNSYERITRNRNETDRRELRSLTPNDNTQDRLTVVPCGSSGTVRVSSGRVDDGTVIYTSSLEETNKTLANLADTIYDDPDPEIIRQAVCEGARTYEQRILVRYLQPPPVPEPGPLIVEERYSAEVSLLPPLVIKQQAPDRPAPPPLILRERPPTPPPSIPSETSIRVINSPYVSRRSVIIQRLPTPPEKPRDILIERWLPYGPQPPRRTIIRQACGPSMTQQRNQILECMTVEPRVVRKFKTLRVTEENPADYAARYRGSLLDSATLLQQARDAGVYEDISLSALTSSSYAHVGDSTVDSDYYNEITYRRSPFPDGD